MPSINVFWRFLLKLSSPSSLSHACSIKIYKENINISFLFKTGWSIIFLLRNRESHRTKLAVKRWVEQCSHIFLSLFYVLYTFRTWTNMSLYTFLSFVVPNNISLLPSPFVPVQPSINTVSLNRLLKVSLGPFCFQCEE